MDRPAPFSAEGTSVVWSAHGHTFRLKDSEVETILDIFERERAVALFNTLHDALVASGGVERVSSLLRAA
jgi:hypothetical protein